MRVLLLGQVSVSEAKKQTFIRVCCQTCCSSYSLSTSDWETGVMSRCSLRLDDGLLDHRLPHSSASFSVGGGEWRSSRSLKSRHSQRHSASCSESLLLRTPCKVAARSLHDSSVHSVVSDASLISSLLDESSIQESTMVDAFWESTVVAEQSGEPVNSTQTGSDRCTKHPAQTFGSRVYCKDCITRSPSSPGETDTTIYSRERSYRSTTARSRPGGGMKEPNPMELLPKGSLCDDCKEKQRSKAELVTSSSSWSTMAAGLLELTCRAAAVAGSATCFLVQLCLRAAAALRPLIRTVFAASLRSGRAAGRTTRDGFRWLCRRCRHMTTSSHLRRFPLGLFIILLPLLLIFSLSWFGPDGFQSLLPALNITVWWTAVSDVPTVSSVRSVLPPPAEGAVEETAPQVVLVVDDSDRLERVEQSLMVLWQRVEARGRRVEQKHREVLRLHADLLQQQLLSSSQSAGDGVDSLVEQQLSQLHTRLDEDRRQREEGRQQDLLHQRRQASRLDRLELQLQALTSRTQEVQLMQEASPSVSSATLPAAVGGGVDQLSLDALLEEVSLLETALGDVRRDVDDLSLCQDGCRELDRIQRTISDQVSAQIRDEVRVLIYRDHLLSPDGDVSVPESLIDWLFQRFVSVDDLEAALVSLELRILQNITLQRREGTVQGDEPKTTRTAGTAGTAMTREDVHEMLTEALRLFSEDRTGLADYALESGGGSVLSTRCSETYETKAALLSLFGVPLWYFSQSPRAVIQPDVHPGNCWAFRGSTGFLVIRLSMRILPTAFTLEHIPKALAPSGTLLSAPRDFSVYGLDDDGQERRKLLGTFSYDQDGDAVQTFPASEENDDSFQIIEVQVLSNWGHPEYTCMYRFRVHGTPRDV
ncbi:SUN domain-containing protein 1-like isoform X2 [Melanotaenia boesemani]|uniref:SUN domain-containing protein 1-like isoform X2 n=1 Tax=Melanotaenia boesemani TaxID=1250792 RepID=UPI001C043F10|nr:SUN domain-containing protein 1-like isoform X2 [Melanotaenia boesemani]